MRIILFLFILPNIYFNYAEKQESSAYSDVIFNAILRHRHNFDEWKANINILKQIWNPLQLLFELVKNGNINQEETLDIIVGNNSYLSKVTKDTAFFISLLLTASDSLKTLSSNVLSPFNSGRITLPIKFSSLHHSLSPVSPIIFLNSNVSSSLISLTSNFSTSSSSVFTKMSNSSSLNSTSFSPVTSPNSTSSFPVTSPNSTSSSPVTSPNSTSSSPVTSPNSTSSSPVTSPNSTSSSPVTSPNSTSSSPNTTSPNTSSTATSNVSSLMTTVQTAPPTTTDPDIACLTDLWDMGHALIHSTNYSWILKMLDSVGKPASGIMDGATTWLGSYDECFVDIPADQRPTKNLDSLQGKYCLASFSTSKEIQQFSMGLSLSINEGLCVPSSCSPDFLKDLLNVIMNKTINDKPSLENLTVSQLICPSRSQKLDTRAIGVLCLLSVILLLIVLGTFYDLIIHHRYIISSLTSYSTLNEDKEGLDENEGHDEIEYKPHINEDGHMEKGKTVPVVIINKPGIIGKILMCFSFYSNGAKILNVDQTEGTLSCIHGIRFLSMSWVILGHAYTFGLIDFSNLLDMLPYMNKFLFQAIENAFVSVDSFFLLSGTLVSYTFMKMYAAGKISWILFYFHRFWRLTPAYMLTLGTYVALMKYLGNGPLWKTDGTEINYCATTWWYNLLYINNFDLMTAQCMGWSWYLANDMQFYVISPIILYPLARNKLLGFSIIGILMLATCITSGVISTVYDLPASPIMVQNINDSSVYMDKYYSKPYCRIGPYLIGIILGYILHTTNCNYSFKRRWIPWLGWCVAIVMNMSIVYGLENIFGHAPLSTHVNALYNSLHRTGWAIGLGWVIFTCVTGYAGFVNTILSWKLWIPLSRLSYCAYLIHPVILFIFFYNQKFLFMISQYLLVYLFLGNLIMSYAIAFVISLAFESPMMGLEKILLSRKSEN